MKFACLNNNNLCLRDAKLKIVSEPTDLNVVDELEERQNEDLRLVLAASKRRVNIVQLKRTAFL